MKKIKLLALLSNVLVLSAYAGIGQSSHVELTMRNTTTGYSMRCYGLPVRQGDVGDMYKNMSQVIIGDNDVDRGRLIADDSTVHGLKTDSVKIAVDYKDSANSYNVSWAVCYVYPSVHLSCLDENYQTQQFDSTEKTSANAYSYETINTQYGGPDPKEFLIPAREDYDDYKAQDRHDSPLAVIEIGITPTSGAFYNIIPLYNPGSDYNRPNGLTDMTYKYEGFGQYDNCETRGLKTGALPDDIDTSQFKLTLVYSESKVGTLADKLQLDLSDNAGI